MQDLPRPARQITVAIVGTMLVLIGLAMVVLPGPAIVVLPLGIAILATEFTWARRWAKYLGRSAKSARVKLRDLFGKK